MAVPGKKATKQFSSSTISIGSDEDLQVYCMPCDRDGPRLPAHGYCTNCTEHLCETCFILHKKHTLSRHHTLIDKANMPQTMSSVIPAQSDNLTKPCPRHSNESIKYYCHDHEALLCSVCVTLEHTRTSCNFNYIPDVSSTIVNSIEYQDILQTMNDITKKADNKLEDLKKMNDTSNKSLTDALMDIKQFRTKINQRLDELEKQLKETVKDIQEENDKKMTRVEKEFGDLSKLLNATSDAITHFNTSTQANDLFMELKLAKQMVKENEKNLDQLTAFDIKEYNFISNEAVLKLLSKERSVGTLRGGSLDFKMKSRHISDAADFIVNIPNERFGDDSVILGMALLTPNILVITDRDDKTVKMIDNSKGSVLDQQKVDSGPYDVSLVTKDEIAVTMPENGKIQFMSVTGNNLRKKQSINVDGKCTGISCHRYKMVVAFTDPAMVQVVRVDGTVLQTIQVETVLKSPMYVTTSDKYIYVSDIDMKTISKLNWQGGVKDIYDCKSVPRGLKMSGDGTVFVCYDNNTISEISEEFTKEETIVKDIENPLAVCWSPATRMLYTSCEMLYTGFRIRKFKF